MSVIVLNQLSELPYSLQQGWNLLSFGVQVQDCHQHLLVGCFSQK